MPSYIAELADAPCGNSSNMGCSTLSATDLSSIGQCHCIAMRVWPYTPGQAIVL